MTMEDVVKLVYETELTKGWKDKIIIVLSCECDVCDMHLLLTCDPN